MKKFFLYILKSYCCTVIAITIYVFFMAVIVYDSDKLPIEESLFSSPLSAVLICDLIYPIYNMPIIVALYKYRLSITEIAIESLFLINIITYIDNFINFCRVKLPYIDVYFGSNNHEITHLSNSSNNYIYGICITMVLCFAYISIKQAVIKKKSNIS